MPTITLGKKEKEKNDVVERHRDKAAKKIEVAILPDLSIEQLQEREDKRHNTNSS